MKDKNTGNNDEKICDAETLPEDEANKSVGKKELSTDDKGKIKKTVETVEDEMPIPESGQKENPSSAFIKNIVHGEMPANGNKELKQDDVINKECDVEEEALSEDEVKHQEKEEKLPSNDGKVLEGNEEIENTQTIPEDDKPVSDRAQEGINANIGKVEPTVPERGNSVWPPVNIDERCENRAEDNRSAEDKDEKNEPACKESMIGDAEALPENDFNQQEGVKEGAEPNNKASVDERKGLSPDNEVNDGADNEISPTAYEEGASQVSNAQKQPSVNAENNKDEGLEPQKQDSAWPPNDAHSNKDEGKNISAGELKGEKEIEDVQTIPESDDTSHERGQIENPPEGFIENIVEGNVPIKSDKDAEPDIKEPSNGEKDIPPDNGVDTGDSGDGDENAPTQYEDEEPQLESGHQQSSPDIEIKEGKGNKPQKGSSEWPPQNIQGGESGGQNSPVGRGGDVPPQQNIPLPDSVYAHFLLININATEKEIRGVPRYLRIEKTRTLIGRYRKAHIYFDDPKVSRKHAKVIYEERNKRVEFIISSIEADVYVNGKKVNTEGIALENGDTIEIGSARLIFFMKDLRNGVNHENRM